jgi:CxxC-x17-CxxC domain-containing protein
MAQAYTDKTLKCVDCGADFPFSADQQAHFADLGFTNEPKRCPPCRAEKKRQHGNGGNAGGGGGGRPPSGPREFHTTTCAGCGGEARVPFKPRGDRPVYCSNCFDSKK